MSSRQRALASLALMFACSLTVASATPSGAATPTPPEYQVKGAYLFNFIRLVEWPLQGVPGGWALPVCVLGDSPIAGALESMAGSPVRGRRLVVRRIDSISDGKACPVLFIPDSAGRDIDTMLKALSGSVLTVSEVNTDDRLDSVINFVVENERVGFDVNVEAATRARLSLSARLLSVARSVDGRKRRRD